MGIGGEFLNPFLVSASNGLLTQDAALEQEVSY